MVAPGAIRTRDLRIRSPTLYPIELQALPYMKKSSLGWTRVEEGARTLNNQIHNLALYH